jgi:ribonuclease P protein component
VGGRYFSLFYSPGGTERHRLGLTVPRRVGNAVVRNRVKRRLREIFRLNRGALGEDPLDIVINVFPEASAAGSDPLRTEFLREMDAARGGRGRPGRGRRPQGRGRVRSTGSVAGGGRG